VIVSCEAVVRTIVVAAALSFSVACGQAGPPAARGSRTIAVRIVGPGRVLSMPPGIDCPGICVAAFPPGTSMTMVAAPPENGSFREWGGPCRGSTGCMFDLTSDDEILAIFDPM
jgi:hypothetical protein